MRSFFLGVLSVFVILIAGAFALVWFGYVPAAADSPPPFPGEKSLANRAINATIAREEPQPPYPFGPPTDATVLAGAKLYLANCAVCHGSAGSDESNIAKGQYVPTPQFTKHGVTTIPQARRTGKSSTATASPVCRRSRVR